MGPVPNIAKSFSVNLEFNLDTATSSIILDSAVSSNPDSVPLVRLQVLYKKGDEGLSNPGWNVLPFVPFKDAAHPTNPGWYKLVDTTITRAMYKTLPDSWRAPDTVGSGNAHSWKFKQLHVVLNDIPSSMDSIIKHTDNLKGDYGSGILNTPIATFQHPDFLVAVDSTDGNYFFKGANSMKKVFLLETQILSTYRTTVRVRSLTWQDTTVDKFLYRKISGDTTRSMNPNDALNTYSSYDDSIRAIVNRWASNNTSHAQREILFNDTDGPFSGLSSSAISLCDWHLSKVNMHTHIREQEGGDLLWSRHFRRERMSYDGAAPSVFENQIGVFYSNRYAHPWWELISTDTNTVKRNKLALDIFPEDYVANAKSFDINKKWPTAAEDTMVGLIIGRRDTIGDGLSAYRQYETNNTDRFLNQYIPSIRSSSILALRHPFGKRHAMEASIQGWGIIITGAHKSSSLYNDSVDHWVFPKDTMRDNNNTVRVTFDLPRAAYGQRPTTPEETSGLTYTALANGATAFNMAQCFDNGAPGGGAPGAFGYARRISLDSPLVLSHSYNFGHRRALWHFKEWTQAGDNDCEGPLPEYYLGYSNTWKAFKRAFSRINEIYDTLGGNLRPFKHLRWEDAYSTHKSFTVDTTIHPINEDSVSKNNAFLKCFCTTSVKRWTRGTHHEYIDSISVLDPAQLTADAGEKTFVEVGLFKDSLNSTSKNYAALIVNTRLWPSLRDAEDSIYYNTGLDSAKDRSKSTLGDIDTRKVWFHIDTSKMDASSRATYYVVRDMWHPDSVWLVKNDSNFAIYLKPGDAKFLYFEKGVAIRMAKTSATEEAEYAFNNGRRVAEIYGGRRVVGTYVRGGKLYVAYPRAGETIEGYAEHSAGDNIATGHEILLDSATNNCHRPSISAGINDTSVAIVYWDSVVGAGGRIKAAYQKHPDSAWKFTTFINKVFADTTSDKSEVTPVITPYPELDFSTGHFHDSIWLVAAAYQGVTAGPPTNPQGIAALKLRIYRDSIGFVTDNPMKYFYKNLVNNPTRDASAFPTITSRPLLSTRFPVRLAWQNYGKILYNRYKDTSVTADLANPFVVSDGLPSMCYNRHPSIAMHSLRYRDIKGEAADSIPPCGCCCTPGGVPTVQNIGPDSTYKEYDEVVWESKLFGNGVRWNTNNHYWPVLRQRMEYLQIFNTPSVWSSFRVFKPAIDSEGFHYPIVNAASRSDMSPIKQNQLKKKSVYFDDIRIAWQDKTNDLLDFAHYVYGWKRSKLLEDGSHPSLPQSTFDIGIMSDSSNVPRSVGFAGTELDNGKNQVRVTNGWFPKVSIPISTNLYPSFLIGKKGDLMDCLPIHQKSDYFSVVDYRGGGAYRTVDWLSLGEQTDPIQIRMPDTLNRIAFFTDTLTVNPDDSIVIARRIDTMNLTAIRASLADSSDYIITRTTLRKYSDSSYVATIDTSIIKKGVALYPGYGRDSNYATYRRPIGATADTMFIMVEIFKGNQSDSLTWTATEYYTDEAVAMGSFKRSFSPTTKSILPSVLKVDVVPNPFTQSTVVKIKSTEGLITHVEVFDVLGRKISDLYNENFPSSPVEIKFEAAMLSAGAYYVRIQSGSEVVTRKIQLVK